MLGTPLSANSIGPRLNPTWHSGRPASLAVTRSRNRLRSARWWLGDYPFLVGGKNGVLTGNAAPDTCSSKVASDGMLGAWTLAAPLPARHSSLAVTPAGDFLYATGGFDAAGLASVFAARVRFAGS